MQQKRFSEKEHEEIIKELAKILETSRRTSGGFAFDSEKVLKTFDHSAEEREKYYERLWEQVCLKYAVIRLILTYSRVAFDSTE